jgi:hypothetical protein
MDVCGYSTVDVDQFLDGVTIAGDGLLLLNLRECMGILSDHYLELDARDYVFSQSYATVDNVIRVPVVVQVSVY